VDAQIHLWGSGLPSNMAHRQVTSGMAFKAVRDFPGRFAILGAFPLNAPDKRALVETWRSQPGMLGLRYGFLQEPMRRIAERHPGLRLTIDHLGGRGGTTTLKDDAAMEHMPELIKLARHPNVAVKATGAAGRIRSRACTRTCARSTTRSGRRACSGEPTSRRCRAPGGSA
jgi:hypothetical protein